MLAKYLTASLVGSALLATTAFAQTTGTAPERTAAAPIAASASFNGDWRTSKVVGLNVYNDNNESLGSINDLLMDKSGTIKAAVIGVGGFLGVGEHLVAVSFDKIKFIDEPVATTSASNSSSGGTSGMSSNKSNASSGMTTGSAPAAAATKANPWYPDHAVFNATKDELKAMPEFKYSSE